MMTKAEADAGVTRYALLYVKNTHATETAKNFTFWEYGGSTSSDTTIDWARGGSGKNGTEPTIADYYTEPSNGPVWRTTQEQVDCGSLAPGDIFPIWFRNIADAGTAYMKGDKGVYKFKVTIPSGGMGTDPDPSGGGTGGTGGNPVPTTIDWKIAVVGDWGTESVTDDVMDMCNSYDKIISVGDNGYGDTNGWIDLANEHNFKNKLIGFAFGNHEEDDGYSAYKNWFGVSQAYFMKKFQNVACITIDSNVNNDDGSAQHEAVEGFLNNAVADPSIDWIFATMHHPWFGSESDHGLDNNDIVEAYHSLFTSKKVAFVFTGHNHNWQRSAKCSYNSGDPTDPNIVDVTSPYDNTTSGLIHVVSGTGGHDSAGDLYELKTDLDGQVDNPNVFQNDNNNGIYEILASNNGKTLTCRFKAIDGDTFDTITYNAT